MILSLLVPALVQSIADPAPHRFAPPLDSEWRYRIEETRELGDEIDRYRLDRTVRFTRDGDGYAATMVTVAVDGGVGSGTGAMFEATMASFIGHPVVFRLNALGIVTGIDEMEAHYGRWHAAMIDLGLRETPDDRRSAVRKALGDRLTRMPPAARLAFLGSMLAAVLPSADLPSTVTPLRPLSQQGAGVTLGGTRRAYRTANGRLAIEDRLSGTGTGSAGPFELHVTELREIDPAAGLIRSAIRVRRTVTGEMVQTITTRTTMDPPDPD